ncbi:endoglucanase [Clostridia bacterium]|nr:endoglucanase [Clostridia bacterium]
MRAIDNYRAGINFGCWLETSPKDEDKLANWITESDVKQVAGWGYDHVRLPFSYELLEKRFDVLDRVLEWCKKHGLNLILDLHKAPGYSFFNVDAGLPNPFLDESEYQEQFFEIWRGIARRYLSERTNLAFELLNEVVEGPSSRWNAIAKKAIAAIRAIDPERIIIYGGIHYNSCYYMNELEVTDDPNIIYNFHFYEPHIFTHQHSWTPITKLYNTGLVYPGEFTDLDKFFEAHPEHAGGMTRYLGRKFDRETLSMDFEPVREFKRAHPNAQLYCGEYGVIRTASPASKRAWLSDVTDLFIELDVGRGLWDYLDGAREWFSCVHLHNRKPIDEDVLLTCARRN